MLIGRARATSRRRNWRLLDRGATGAGSGGEEAKVTRDFCPLSERPLLEGESAGQRRLKLPVGCERVGAEYWSGCRRRREWSQKSPGAHTRHIQILRYYR